MTSAPTPGRVPLRAAFVWWRLVVAALLIVLAAAFAQRVLRVAFTWWEICCALACVVGAIAIGRRARQNACGACGAIVRPAIIRLPIAIAEELAQSVIARGSLDPALPNHLPPDGAAAYTALLGEVCPRCQRAAKVHVSRYGRLPGSTAAELRVSWEPLTPETLLDEPSAKFLATLARVL